MQMEFERRIQLIDPTLTIDQKPNSDLIFSILNEAQDRYVMMNYVGDDQMETETPFGSRVRVRRLSDNIWGKGIVGSGAGR